MNEHTFEAFGFAEPLTRAITARAYSTPTPIQVQALPPQLDNRDLLALAETGSGKTAAFVLPLLQSFTKRPIEPNMREVVSLILAPTRELALQIDAEIAGLSKFMGLRRAVVLGGVGKNPQIHALKRGVHILVATPGRLLDLVSERHADLRSVRTLILDEADRMFDMGFIRDIRKIVAMVPRQRRTALFSATMPDEIRALANELLTDPARVDLSPKQLVVDRIDQKVMMVRANEKQSRLHTILGDASASRVIVFTRTKRGADRVADRLSMAGFGAAAIHGNKAQNARQRALADFTAGHVRVLVATDIAARGIDVSNVTHVINFDMPVEPETYVHRIGRTARKGESGIAISLCDPAERAEIKAIERLMKQSITVIEDVGGEAVPMPERRPHHAHSAKRHEGAHRGGPSRPTRNGAQPTRRDRHGDKRSASAGDRPEKRDARGPEKRDARGPQQSSQNPRRDGDQKRRADDTFKQSSRKEPMQGERSQRDHKPGEQRHSEHRNSDHRQKNRGNGERSSGATWNGQQPPKFLKQRGGHRGFARPGNDPAA